MSVDFQRNTWRYIPDDKILHNHRSENLKSYNLDHIIHGDKLKQNYLTNITAYELP
jgi:hypothetical protein